MQKWELFQKQKKFVYITSNVTMGTQSQVQECFWHSIFYANIYKRSIH